MGCSKRRFAQICQWLCSWVRKGGRSGQVTCMGPAFSAWGSTWRKDLLREALGRFTTYSSEAKMSGVDRWASAPVVRSAKWGEPRRALRPPGHPASISSIYMDAFAVLYPTPHLVTPRPWHSELPHTNKELPHEANPNGTPFAKHQFHHTKCFRTLVFPLRFKLLSLLF